MKAPEVVVAGDLFADLILSGFDFWPELGREAFARHFAREAGGGAAITASGLARLGMRAAVFGMVGAEDGGWLLERLRQAGVDTSLIVRHASEPTAFTVVASTREDRAFLTYPGANGETPAALRRSADARGLEGVRHVHLACAPELESAPALVAALRGNGCTVSLDVGWHPDWLADPRALMLLRDIELFFPNEPEALLLTGAENADEALGRLAAAGLKHVALKRGADGASLLRDGRVYRGEPRVARTVDVTGAGDCFDAGYLYAWLSGRAPRECLDGGNLCGSLSTEARGGIAAFPELARLLELWA